MSTENPLRKFFTWIENILESFDWSFGRDLRRKFQKIQEDLGCAHYLEESLLIMDFIRNNRDIPGEIVECGVFKGGMTAKLSFLAKRFNKQVYAYDSYEGLPDPARYGTGHQVEYYRRQIESGNNYSGSLDEVKMNISKYGHLDRCVLIEGLFEESFAREGIHPWAIAFAFVDVDLTFSFRQCLEFIWPKLSEGGILFCHEARDVEIDNEIVSHGLLKYENQGVGTGLGKNMENLCWIKKRK